MKQNYLVNIDDDYFFLIKAKNCSKVLRKIKKYINRHEIYLYTNIDIRVLGTHSLCNIND